jgi:hypothetical protein
VERQPSLFDTLSRRELCSANIASFEGDLGRPKTHAELDRNFLGALQLLGRAVVDQKGRCKNFSLVLCRPICRNFCQARRRAERTSTPKFCVAVVHHSMSKLVRQSHPSSAISE